MDNKIENGDWAVTRNTLSVVYGEDEMIGHVEARLSAKKGRFYPNKDFGSLLYTLKDSQDENKDMLALQYSRQALSDMSGVFVEKAIVADDEAKIKIAFDNRSKEVIIKL